MDLREILWISPNLLTVFLIFNCCRTSSCGLSEDAITFVRSYIKHEKTECKIK